MSAYAHLPPARLHPRFAGSAQSFSRNTNLYSRLNKPTGFFCFFHSKSSSQFFFSTSPHTLSRYVGWPAGGWVGAAVLAAAPLGVAVHPPGPRPLSLPISIQTVCLFVLTFGFCHRLLRWRRHLPASDTPHRCPSHQRLAACCRASRIAPALAALPSYLSDRITEPLVCHTFFHERHSFLTRSAIPSKQPCLPPKTSHQQPTQQLTQRCVRPARPCQQYYESPLYPPSALILRLLCWVGLPGRHPTFRRISC